MSNQSIDLRNSKYVVEICRDRQMMLTFLKFRNRVEHPLSGVYLFSMGAVLILLPMRTTGIKPVGVAICYGMGTLMVLISLLRNYISLSLMKGSPQYVENERMTYYFGSSAIRTVKDAGKVEKTDYYKDVKTIWEDEKHYYVGLNDADLMILPKAKIAETDGKEFREFLLEKTGAALKWKPAKWKNILKDLSYKLQAKMQDGEQK